MNMAEFNALYKRTVEADMEGNRQSAMKSLDYLANSTAQYHGQTIYSLYMPKAFPEQTVSYLRVCSETMYGILIKVMKRFFEDEGYRKLFGFKPEQEQWLLMNPGYRNILPIARLDIFLNETDLSFKFCEFNADGSSSMNEDRELNIALKMTKAYQELSGDYDFEPFELFDSWVREFMDIYSTYPGKTENPHIAIVDFLEKGCSMEEFNEFKNAFIRCGYSAEIAEIRDLVFDGSVLRSPSGRAIDAIYRRAVTSDVFEHIHEVKPFMNAVAEGKVCLIGSFCTQIIHNKILFLILRLPETSAFLSADEIDFIEKHIPYTLKLTDEEISREQVAVYKDRWLIKPEDSYGAKGVYAGISYTASEWLAILDKHKNTDYILQEFVQPYKSFNIDFKKSPSRFIRYSNLTGMYMYNGKFAGIYSRQSNHEIISTQYDENDVASVSVRRRAGTVAD